MLGKVLGNRYQIVEQLGGGGMALVYRAKCTLLNRDVTVKLLRPEFTSDPEFINRFRREAQAVASLSHPNIVSLYDVGREDDTHYIVMEYIDGRNLKEIIRERGPLPAEEAVNIAKQICDALEHAHENDIIHRDIKPHNILITKAGRAKVTDFGIARAATSSTMTTTGTIVGSVHYISPEQARGENSGTRSDLYSLGVVLYEMVTGKVPFEADSPISIALKHIQEQPIPPSRLNPKISPELEKVILRAMEKDPNQRYHTAREMAMDLKTVLYGRISEETMSLHNDEDATIFMPAVDVPADGSNIKEQNRKKMKPFAWAVLAIFIVGALMGLGYSYFNGFVNTKTLEVPKVTGYDKNRAKTILIQSGFKNIELKYEYSEEPTDQVIQQEPNAGQQAKEERPITLIISQGPRMKLVPDVSGMPKEEAQNQIESEGFEVGNTTEINDDDVPLGSVIEQSPKGGQTRPESSKIDLVISKGPLPQWLEMPDLTGLTLEEAKNKLAGKKLQVNEDLQYAQSGEYFEGYVIGQNPEAGTEVEEGSKITITVSQGPGPSESTYNLMYTVPADGEVKIVVKDAKGTREVYRQEHAYKDSVILDVVHYGRATIQYYINNLLSKEELVG